jgi:signal transduction histidine kinase/ActR/RegA family two-component response regulator
MPLPLVIVSPGGEILAANTAARNELSIGDERTLAALFPGDDANIEQYLRMCRRTTGNVPGAFRKRRDGRERVFRCEGARLQFQDTDLQPVVLLRFAPRDAPDSFILLTQKLQELRTEVRRRREVEAALRASEAELRERASEAERASRLKDEFLAAVSHELRTPLNAISGWADLLRDPKTDEARQARGLEVIARNARIQTQLIDELLDVSRIITGKMRLNVMQLDPIVPIEAAIETLRPALEAKRIRLQTVLDPQAGPVSGDPDRLQQVVWNLLSNAMKFTSSDGRIQIILERINSHVQITVTDSGKGIDAAFLPHVFERFRQQDATPGRSYGGLGLGLAIVKSLVELHGGSITIYSEGADKGTTAVVKLPRRSVRTTVDSTPFQTATHVAAPSVSIHNALVDLDVLVVDDEVDSAEMLVELLAQHGARARMCTSAREAFISFQRTPPDILISDIGMPVEDGYMLIERIRRLSKSDGGATPAIALTAFTRSADRTKALKAGFQAHVSKPIELEELIAVIGSVTSR